MAELIAKIILGGSLIGIGMILVRKIPILVEMPEMETKELEQKSSFLRLGARLGSLKLFSPNLVLQKILSKVRILILRIERKTDDKLQKLREEAKRKKDIENDNYWEELKKVKSQKDKDLPE